MFIAWEIIQLIALRSKYFRLDNLVDLASFGLIVFVVAWDLAGNDVIVEV